MHYIFNISTFYAPYTPAESTAMLPPNFMSSFWSPLSLTNDYHSASVYVHPLIAFFAEENGLSVAWESPNAKSSLLFMSSLSFLLKRKCIFYSSGYWKI